MEEEEEGTGVASDVVKVEGEDPDTPGYQGGTGQSWDVGDLGSWLRLPWLAHDEVPGQYITIPQYWFNKTQQHTIFLELGTNMMISSHRHIIFLGSAWTKIEFENIARS